MTALLSALADLLVAAALLGGGFAAGRLDREARADREWESRMGSPTDWDEHVTSAPGLREVVK